ncbi:MAG: tautomerase family protein [Limnohabitans sp.]|nr:tautomerase family protein [Limnohabitans sp.]
MPLVEIRYVKEQVNELKKAELVNGIMDIIVNIMHRNPDLTVLIVDEVESKNWLIGGKPLIFADKDTKTVVAVNIKISKGTSNPEEMLSVIKAGKDLINKIFGNGDLTNYFVIQELNSDSWGFDGISMTERNRLER